MPSVSSLIIASIWAVVIIVVFRGAANPPLPEPLFFGKIPLLTIATVLSLPVLVFGLSSLWMRHSPFYHPKLAELVNARLGPNTLESFLVRLRPMLLFAVAAMLHSLVGFWRSYKSDAPPGVYLTNAFFMSAGVAFTLAHAVLYFRKAIGVYPICDTHRALADMPERKPLREALRVYWWTLLGVGLFPLILIIGGEFLHIPFEAFMLPFFVVMFLAGWPWLSGRATYSFWLVACAVWILGGIVAVILLELIRAIIA